ncbi:hypothetical protein JIN84_17850 [Luteolibacter yonseiensis]|uniref:Uncharacterized protein n=1 Tax=Luteolibacter yonseiensis TaxID=1144680 RepID=A0A934R9G7_9BACT|nr:hypothetical protein [Luteolibacter yonseiensis]MBK1817489.1 hypothetical protein [Luteolibacter yonseiensis]
MIGFITTPGVSSSLTAAIADAQTSRGWPVVWLLLGIPVITGEHVGNHFIPADDAVLACPVREDLTPADFPEFAELISQLGGLDARIDLNPEAILSHHE